MITQHREGILEKAAACSMRPSRYAGCEIGSIAAKPWPQGPGGRAALIWCASYERAMQDERLAVLYARLAQAGILVNRFTIPEADYREQLAQWGEPNPWFSLEHKQPLEAFDGFIVAAPEGSTALQEAAGRAAHERGLPLVLVPPGPLEEESVKRIVAMFKQGAVDSPAVERKMPLLLAYRSAESPQYRAHRASVRPRFARPTAYRAQCSRAGWSRFVSHLEQIQLLKSAVFLAGLPVALGEGKKPRAKMSFGPAVSVGWESQTEFFDMLLEEPLTMDEMAKNLGAALPPGYGLGKVQRIPAHFPSLEESANWAEYWVEEAGQSSLDWERLLVWFQRLSSAGAEPVVVRKEKPGKKVDLINAADVVGGVSLKSGGPNSSLGVKLSLRFGPKKNLKPEKILEIALGLEPRTIQTELKISRTALALELGSGRLRYL
ncbi:MAG: DUF2344 domain-containing protein [Elusimicrobia bacterium]|nr:DUF2344 domain-containing protein [Elusimicrobiota bacterium]